MKNNVVQNLVSVVPASDCDQSGGSEERPGLKTRPPLLKILFEECTTTGHDSCAAFSWRRRRRPADINPWPAPSYVWRLVALAQLLHRRFGGGQGRVDRA